MTEGSIKKFYNESVAYEWKRVIQDPYHRLEFDTTMKFLKKYLPRKGLILDAGGGPGRYTIELAKRGYEVVLLDLAPVNLKFAKRQIRKAKVQNRVKDIVEGSITDLSRFKSNTFDAVICLGGPLSHVEGKEKRNKALLELIRVAKKGSPIFVNVYSRLGVVMGAPRYFSHEIAMTKHFKELSECGEDYMWRQKYYAHFFLPEELKQFFTGKKVKVIETVGLEGISSRFREEINKLAKNPKAWKNWLAAHYKLCTHPAIVATSEHVLIISRKIKK